MIFAFLLSLDNWICVIKINIFSQHYANFVLMSASKLSTCCFLVYDTFISEEVYIFFIFFYNNCKTVQRIHQRLKLLKHFLVLNQGIIYKRCYCKKRAFQIISFNLRFRVVKESM